jgi:hypothetical protein
MGFSIINQPCLDTPGFHAWFSTPKCIEKMENQQQKKDDAIWL